MTREEAKRIAQGLITDFKCESETMVEFCNVVIEALEQEPCEDCISRQAAIDAFERFIHEIGIEDEPYNYGEMALSIENVPPVTPQQKIGHWIQVDSYRCRCDQCEIMQFIAMYSNGSKNYCPNCGCRMVEPQESEVQYADSN